MRAWPELRILDVEHPDALVIGVDEAEVVELLQDEVTGVVEQVAARMVAGALQEHLERDAVMQVLARMNLVAEVDFRPDRRHRGSVPALGQFVEGRLDQPGGRCGQG